MISPEEAWSRLASHIAPLPTTTRPRRDALGAVLAAAVRASVDVPFADVSAMDGYALAAGPAPGVVLPVVGTVAAGDPPGFQLAEGQACRIMTGAPVPQGADRVVPVEDTDGGKERVQIRRIPSAGAHIRRRGEVHRRGDEILATGTPLTPGGLGLLATHGVATVSALRRPQVAVLSTGDEVVPPEATPAPGQLRDAHTDFLLAAGRTLGLAFTSLGIAGDSRASLEECLAAGRDQDVLLVCGGVSKGAFDFVEDALAAEGFTPLFDAVSVQPGKPLVAAVAPRRIAFGLPGNPASVMVCFWLFVRPALRRLQGHEDGFWHGALEARLSGPLPAARGRDRFLPAELACDAGNLHARPFVPGGSHDLAAYARGNALVRVRASRPERGAGEACEVLPLLGWPP